MRPLLSTQSDATGRYVISGVAPDRRYEVVVWMALGYVAELQDRDDESVRKKNVEPGASRVDFALSPPSEGG